MWSGQGNDQPTPDVWERPWWQAVLFCLFIAPVIIAAATIFAGLVLVLLVNVLGF